MKPRIHIIELKVLNVLGATCLCGHVIGPSSTVVHRSELRNFSDKEHAKVCRTCARMVETVQSEAA